MTYSLNDILMTYQLSNAEATKALYQDLTALGPLGEIAVNLFRAQKASSRAKVYRGSNGRGSYRRQSYDKKNWSLENLCELLGTHAAGAGIRWGWKMDPAQDFHNWVLYVDLPTGQVSFHSGHRGAGPDYPGDWDKIKDIAPTRISRWIVDLFKPPAPAVPTAGALGLA